VPVTIVKHAEVLERMESDVAEDTEAWEPVQDLSGAFPEKKRAAVRGPDGDL
jgi:hypothetical protein